jgi:nitroimidazol reductase NimA-like FMN-containing flavoprotein (pyridoxamine 5'-phosphate oxidase superfamily)
MTTAELQIIDAEECYLLLQSRSLGRVGVYWSNDVVILPVYYAVVDRDIVFRTASGTKLNAAVLGDPVAFEVDNAVPGWSVLAHGRAHEINEPAARDHARARLGSDWPAGERESLVRIEIERITGRRLPGAH